MRTREVRIGRIIVPCDLEARRRSIWVGGERAPGMTRRRVAQLGQEALDTTSDNVFLRLRLPEEIATAFLKASKALASN